MKRCCLSAAIAVLFPITVQTEHRFKKASLTEELWQCHDNTGTYTFQRDDSHYHLFIQQHSSNNTTLIPHIPQPLSAVSKQTGTMQVERVIATDDWQSIIIQCYDPINSEGAIEIVREGPNNKYESVVYGSYATITTITLQDKENMLTIDELYRRTSIPTKVAQQTRMFKQHPTEKNCIESNGNFLRYYPATDQHAPCLTLCLQEEFGTYEVPTSLQQRPLYAIATANFLYIVMVYKEQESDRYSIYMVTGKYDDAWGTSAPPINYSTPFREFHDLATIKHIEFSANFNVLYITTTEEVMAIPLEENWSSWCSNCTIL
ncbi:hypothetical protein M1466_01265 [Candidatus Dependentiae bacterium]|nr:hypothetical protein [Candidatus Dependentiae bacterium]